MFFTLSSLASSELQPQTLLPGKELTHGVLCVNCKHEDAVFISRQSRGTLETKKSTSTLWRATGIWTELKQRQWCQM